MSYGFFFQSPSFDSQITFPERSSIENNSIQSNTTTASSYTNRKSKVWDYFSIPYGIPNSSKTKCHVCGKEFSYSGSPSSLKYHLIHKHNIDVFTNNSNNSIQHKKSSSRNNDNLNSQISFSSGQEINDVTTNKTIDKTIESNEINETNEINEINEIEINERNSIIKNNSQSSVTYYYTNRKSKVWNYFTMPYCLSDSKERKTRCHECKKEFSYSGSPSSLKYHLTHKHNIDMSQIK